MKYTASDFQNLKQGPSNLKLRFTRPIGKVVNGLLFLYGCLKVIKNPLDTDTIIRSAESLAHPNRFEQSQVFLTSTATGKEIFRTRPAIPRLDALSLKASPGSLGWHYLQHLKSNNLDANFFEVEYFDEISYSFYRFGKLHDLSHVVTGFSTTVSDEIGLLGYSFAQTLGPGLMLIASLAFLHGVFFKPGELLSYVRSFHRGFTLGQNLIRLPDGQNLPFLLVNWEQFINSPLEEVQTMAGILPAKPQSY